MLWSIDVLKSASSLVRILSLIFLVLSLTGCLTPTEKNSASTVAPYSSAPSKFGSQITVYFETASALLTPEAADALGEIGNVLKNPSNSAYVLEIVGHADERGDEVYNQHLSDLRAQAVALFLFSEFNISPDKMAVYGNGELTPIAKSSGETSWASNRRVEIQARVLPTDSESQAKFSRWQLDESRLEAFRNRLEAHSISDNREPISLNPKDTNSPTDIMAEPPCADVLSCNEAGRGISTGTAFFISSNHLLTNEHVIRDSVELFLSIDSELVEATVVDINVENDLALLYTHRTGSPLQLSGQLPRKGSEVAVLGYPSIGLLGSDQKATFGNINSLSGLNDDPSMLQFDAPIQPGNSGSPVMLMDGQVVGVATASLNQEVALEEIGVLAQSVNFASKISNSQTLAPRPPLQSKRLPEKAPADLVEQAEGSVVLVLNYFKPGSETQEARLLDKPIPPAPKAAPSRPQATLPDKVESGGETVESIHSGGNQNATKPSTGGNETNDEPFHFIHIEPTE